MQAGTPPWGHYFRRQAPRIVTFSDHPNVFRSLADDDPSANPATVAGRRVAEEALMKPKSTLCRWTGLSDDRSGREIGRDAQKMKRMGGTR